MARTSNYLRGSGARGGWFSWRAFVYVFLFVLLCGAAIVWRQKLETLVWDAAAPLARLHQGFDTSEVVQLQAQLASTTALVADRDALYQENLNLKARLGRDGSGAGVILAGVSMRPPATPYDTLLVDAGQAEGVAQGDIVSPGGTTVIGSVEEVYTHTSRVELYSAPGQTFDVLLRGTVPMQMQGQGGGSFVGQLPAGTAVVEGDTLLFPGLASGFVGTVSHVVANQGESFETVYAHLPIDPLTLSFVEIQKNNATQ